MSEIAFKYNLSKTSIAEKTMTLKEVADSLGAGYDVIAAKARELGFTKNGVKTFLMLEQVQILKDNYRPSSFEVAAKVNNALTPLDIERMTLQVIQYHQNRVIELEKENKKQKQQITTMQPKAKYFDDFADSSTLIEIGHLGKKSGIGAKSIFPLLVGKKIIYKKFADGAVYYEPYKDYEKYFDSVEKPYKLPDGSMKSRPTLYLTSKGFEFFLNKLAREK